MKAHKFDNIFNNKQLDIFYDAINKIDLPLHQDGTYVYDTEDNASVCSISKSLGRLQCSGFIKDLSDGIHDKLNNIANSVSNNNIEISSITYVEYNSKYGTPDLPPHFDGDSSDLIINFQIDSNTSWDIGIDLEVYSINNNSALVFNGNESIHWRPRKTFNDGEYVKLVFFRFQDIGNYIDNSHLRYSLDNEIYKEVNSFRDSL